MMGGFMNLTEQDASDYLAIKQYVPDANPAEVKQLKQLIDLGREVNLIQSAHELLLLFVKIPNPGIRQNLRRGIKGVFTKTKNERKKCVLKTEQRQRQLSLFHPEAFQGV
jgi:hypothetical protein